MKLKNIEINDLPAVRKFTDVILRKDYIVVKEDFFKWQYCESARILGVKNDNGAYMMVEDGKVVGISFAAKADFFTSKGIKRGAWHQEWYVLPEHSGAGLPLILQQFAVNDLFIVSGQSIDAALVEGKLRNMCWFCLDRLFVVMDAQKTYDLLFLKEPKTFNYLKMQKIAPADQKIKISRVNTFDASYEQVWKQFRKSFVITTDRTANYMNWRYARHPRFKYDIYRFDTKKGAAYFIWRQETIKDTDLKVARICDIIGESPAVMAAFPRVFEKFVEQKNVFADFYCSSRIMIHALLEAGMRHVITLPDFDLPRLFSPLADDVRKSINFVCYLTDDYKDILYRHYEMYFTKGDTNQDRPNY